jgi:transcriptional regulator with XRE-family HTH domain
VRGGLCREWLPWNDAGENKLFVSKNITNFRFILPDLPNAPLGARLRFLRKRRGITIPQLYRLTGISTGTICRIEAGKDIWKIGAVGKLMAFFGPELKEAFPGDKDPYEQAFPALDFASWLRNLRMRKGLDQVQLAKLLGLSRVSICRYETNVSRPHASATSPRITRPD